jgi:23S rRNA (adenine1618-N6)-methyltransferase
MHPRNKHQGSYNFKKLKELSPSLAPYVGQKTSGGLTIDFGDPKAVKELNKALLKSQYGLAFWDIPDNYLCPPIPGRAEYIHLMADLLEQKPDQKVSCLDIGTGANLIYPILGSLEYGWRFVASDIDEKALTNAQRLLSKNPQLQPIIELRKQVNPRDIFRGIIKDADYFDLMFCNPPFYESAREAAEATQRKSENLQTKNTRNFGGQSHELWCQGGEKKFINDIAFQSKFFKDQVGWFSTLVSKKENLIGLYKTLKKTGAEEVKTIPLDLGNKKSRIVAWTYKS